MHCSYGKMTTCHVLSALGNIYPQISLRCIGLKTHSRRVVPLLPVLLWIGWYLPGVCESDKEDVCFDLCPRVRLTTSDALRRCQLLRSTNLLVFRYSMNMDIDSVANDIEPVAL